MTTKKSIAKGPQFTRFFKPLLQTLQSVGGSCTASEATAGVLDSLAVSQAERAELLGSGQSRVRNQVAWARQYLVWDGLIDDRRRGYWTLTEKATPKVIAELEPSAFFHRVHQRHTEKGKKQAVKSSSEATLVEDEVIIANPQIAHRAPLLERIHNLSPKGFELLCQRILRESGFESVAVTGGSNDGGIDGVGILRVNEFVTFSVMFQCKRYSGEVPVGHVRNFRGALEGRADKGLFLSTGYFTKEAVKESRRDGVRPIELIDGEALLNLMEKFQLGLTPITIFEVDSAFFESFQ